MNRLIRASLLAIAVAIALSAPVAATMLLPADFQQMVGESQLIVHARVIDVRGELVGNRRAIESLVTVEVLSPIKGQAVEALAFRVPGGRVGRYRRVFVGAPTFRAGDEVVLFLKGRAPAIAMPFGLSQGVYRVSRASGQPLVIPVPASDGVAGTVRGDPARQPIALDEFTRQIRATLRGAR